MKKKLIGIFLSLFCLMNVFSQNLHLFKHDGKYGYFDDNFRVVIKPKYTSASQFYGEYTLATDYTKGLIIDKNGNVIHETEAYLQPNDTYAPCIRYFAKDCFEYDFIIHHLTEGWEMNSISQMGLSILNTDNVTVNPTRKYIDKNGEDFVFDNYSDYYMLVDGIGCVRDGKMIISIVTKDGKILLDNILDSSSHFSEGLIAIKTKDWSGYINTKGEPVFNCSFYAREDMWVPHLDYFFNEGVAVVQQNKNKWYIFDTKGNSIKIPDEYSIVYGNDELSFEPAFYNGLLLVSKKDKNGKRRFGYLDKQGKIAIPFDYFYAEPFFNGYAVAQKTDSALIGVIDTQGKYYTSKYIMEQK